MTCLDWDVELGDLLLCEAMNTELVAIPLAYHDLLTAPNTAVLSTLSPDGSPQNTPVWFWFDGTSVHVSTVKGRQKYRNLVRDRRLAFTVVDPAQPLRYIEVRGTAELQDDPVGEMRDRIAAIHGYADGSVFDPPDAVRVTVTIVPARVNAG